MALEHGAWDTGVTSAESAQGRPSGKGASEPAFLPMAISGHRGAEGGRASQAEKTAQCKEWQLQIIKACQEMFIISCIQSFIPK